MSLKFFKYSRFTLGNAAAFLSGFGVFSLVAYAPLFLQGALIFFAPLSPEIQEILQGAVADSISAVFRIVFGVAILTLISSLLIRERTKNRQAHTFQR